MQALADPRGAPHPRGCEHYPIVLDQCNLRVNVAAATPMRSLQALRSVANMDLGAMHRSAHDEGLRQQQMMPSQANALDEVRRQLEEESAVRARAVEGQQRQMEGMHASMQESLEGVRLQLEGLRVANDAKLHAQAGAVDGALEELRMGRSL